MRERFMLSRESHQPSIAKDEDERRRWTGAARRAKPGVHTFLLHV
jgi:hypothetical protein